MHPKVQAVADALTARGMTERVLEITEPTHTAQAAADYLGCEVGAIANSLVFSATGGDFAAEGEPILVMTSGSHRVDTAVLAPRIGAGSIGRAKPDVVKSATGQVIGGVAPLGHPAPLPTFVDPVLADYPEIWAAAGIPASVFRLSYDELVALTDGIIVAVD